MDSTTLTAQLIGLFSIVMGLSMVLRRTMLTGIFREMARQRALTYAIGVVMLVLGLLLVLNSTAWEGTAALLITALGWIVLAEAAAFLFLPERAIAHYLNLTEQKKFYFLVAGAYLLLGVFLLSQGF